MADGKKAEKKNVSGKKEKLTNKQYDAEMKRLHVELVKMQEWVKSKGLKVMIVFEGRDGAGKGGVIKAITERVSPRVFRVIALPTPTERQKSQMYLQRYMEHFPAAGEMVIWDRSWYNRAGVERVMGFCAGRARQALPRTGADVREADDRIGHHPAQILARSERGGADPPARRPHP